MAGGCSCRKMGKRKETKGHFVPFCYNSHLFLFCFCFFSFFVIFFFQIYVTCAIKKIFLVSVDRDFSESVHWNLCVFFLSIKPPNHTLCSFTSLFEFSTNHAYFQFLFTTDYLSWLCLLHSMLQSALACAGCLWFTYQLYIHYTCINKHWWWTHTPMQTNCDNHYMIARSLNSFSPIQCDLGLTSALSCII